MSPRRLTQPRIHTPRGMPGRGIRLAFMPSPDRALAMASATEEKSVEKTEKKERPEPADQISITRHRAKIGGREIAYTATCGTVVLKEEMEKEGKHEGEKPRAKGVFIAYKLDDAPDKAGRPATFSFNGGPGSSPR